MCVINQGLSLLCLSNLPDVVDTGCLFSLSLFVVMASLPCPLFMFITFQGWFLMVWGREEQGTDRRWINQSSVSCHGWTCNLKLRSCYSHVFSAILTENQKKTVKGWGNHWWRGREWERHSGPVPGFTAFHKFGLHSYPWVWWGASLSSDEF